MRCMQHDSVLSDGGHAHFDSGVPKTRARPAGDSSTGSRWQCYLGAFDTHDRLEILL